MSNSNFKRETELSEASGTMETKESSHDQSLASLEPELLKTFDLERSTFLKITYLAFIMCQSLSWRFSLAFSTFFISFPTRTRKVDIISPILQIRETRLQEVK